MSEIIALWPDGAKGSESWNNPEKEHIFTQPWQHRIVRNVSNPTLTIFLPESDAATGCGVIICPGGAHHILAVDHEGYDVARWLNTHGIAAFVLKYRVMQTPDDDDQFHAAMTHFSERLERDMPIHQPLIIADGEQALRLVREHAQDWGLHPERIGMIGFSAGGHLTVLVTLAVSAELRPNFIAPIYGARLDDLPVPADMPPMFMALASDDDMARRNCLALFSAWRAAGNSAELHCYASGGHGFGMIPQGLPTDNWIERFYEWLAALGMVEEL